MSALPAIDPTAAQPDGAAALATVRTLLCGAVPHLRVGIDHPHRVPRRRTS